MSQEIGDAALTVLRRAWVEGQVVKIPPEQLPRPVYEEVNEVITRLGGKWKGGRMAGHVFAFYDPAPLLASVQASGLMPPKNPTAFFPTPAPIVADMIRAVDLNEFTDGGFRVLEPSAGTGAIADAIRAAAPEVQLDVCEVLDLNRAVLTAKGYTIVADDFLTWNPGPVYHAVLMNPPFSLPGDKHAWLTHMLHAWSLLVDGGKLTCIAPAGLSFRSDRRLSDARDLILQYGSYEPIAAGAFKESGTGVATALIWMTKDEPRWRERESHGQPNHHQFLLFLTLENDYEDNATFERLIDRGKTDDSVEADVLAFLTRIRERSIAEGEWIAWDEHNQRLALEEYWERVGRPRPRPRPPVVAAPVIMSEPLQTNAEPAPVDYGPLFHWQDA